MSETSVPAVERQSMDVDIVCVGFGPATGGFLTTLTRAMTEADGSPAFESQVMPGMPPQVIAYERADDIGFGVSGVVTRARGIRASFPDFDPAQIPMAAPVRDEKVLYLLDPHGASRRPWAMRAADRLIRAFRLGLKLEHDALELPYTPEFLHKKDGFVVSIGQFNQWVGQQIMLGGAAQVWPATPVAAPLIEGRQVKGVRLIDQGVDAAGNPTEAYLPGMDVRAALTVVGDGPVGPVGREIDEQLGVPGEHQRNEWAVGMKFVIDLAEGVELEPGTVFHTIGYPEPEIFGFFYVHPERVVSTGIFVPSWFDSPVRTAYRYLQHFIQHPYSVALSEGRAAAFLGREVAAGIGQAGRAVSGGRRLRAHRRRLGKHQRAHRLGRGRGLDHRYAACRSGDRTFERGPKPFTREVNLEATYVAAAGKAGWSGKAGLPNGPATGSRKEPYAGWLGWRWQGFRAAAWPGRESRGQPGNVWARWRSSSADRISGGRDPSLREECARLSKPLHDALMERCGWPANRIRRAVDRDPAGRSVAGGQGAGAGGLRRPRGFPISRTLRNLRYADLRRGLLGRSDSSRRRQAVRRSTAKSASTAGRALWNCSRETPQGGNIAFRAGAGGLHSSEN